MTLDPGRQEDELRELLEALCEERITAEQTARLEALVLADPQAEAFYITYMTMQAGLVRECGGSPTILAGERAGGVSGARPEREPVLRPDPEARSGPRRAWSWAPWVLAAAACLVATLTSSLSPWGRPGVERPNVRVLGPGPESGPVATAPGASGAGGGRHLAKDREALAVVMKLVDARWESTDGPAPALGRPVAAGRLRLRSGLATLAFVNGVTLTLEGPADVDLVSIDRVFCRRGKLRTRVPKGAEGFVVASPSSAVVDLGTEFALNVEDDGRAQVMVFEGAAEAALLSDSGAPRRTKLIERSKAFDLDPQSGRIEETAGGTGGFVPAPVLPASSLELDPSYADTVLRSGPRGYWRFEAISAGAVPDEVPGGPPLRVHGPVQIARSPGGNGHAHFAPGAAGQFLDIESLWKLPAEPGHAVELWFLADRIDYSSLVGLYPPRDMNPPDQKDRYLHTFFVEATAWQRQSLQKPASIRFLHRWPIDIRVTADCLFSEGVYVPRRWHHVVAQKAGHRLELFLDGELDLSRPLEPDHPTLSCHLIVGRRTPESENPKDSRSFVGRLDELALYDHPLSAEEVRRHFRLGRERVRPD
jgi:hypothetical protein